jgi:pimeloyl-ACP methyl ester carboxylesterase
MNKPTSSRSGRFGIWLATLLGIAAMTTGLVQLWLPRLPLQYEHLSLDALPVSIVAGKRTAADAPAVIIAHGFAASRQIMLPFADTLAHAGYRVYLLDFPGHGQNPTPLRGDITDSEGRYRQLRAALDEVTALARRRGATEIGLLGHSMGSEAVVRYAQEHPDIAAVVAVSLIYDDISSDSPANLLVITGALEAGLRPLAQQVADTAAGGAGTTETTYGDFTDGTARRVVFAPGVEHIGVLFSPTSMATTLAWFQQALPAAPPAPNPYLDNRAPWLGLTMLGACLLYLPLAQVVMRLRPAPDRVRAPALRRWWWAAALVPTLTAPVAVRLLPAGDWLPILVGGPLALHFAVYGLTTLIGVLVLARRSRQVSTAAGTPVLPVLLQPDRLQIELPIIGAAALLIVGYVFVSFGVPIHTFVLNYFPPIERLPSAAAIIALMLPYFLADEWLTRGPWAPTGAYVITKLLLIASLALAIALNLQLFFLVLIAPLFVAYFVVYGLFSWIVFRRAGTPLIGALANSAIFAWIVAVTFPLVR